MLLQVIRTTFWTRNDPTIRSDEIQEELEMKEIDAEDQRKRDRNDHTSDAAFWVKDHDQINLQQSGICYHISQ